MAENVLEKIINKKIEKIVNLKKTISLRTCIKYIFFQVLGAISSASVLSIIGRNLIINPSAEESIFLIIASEFFFTFLMMFVILLVAIYPKTKGNNYYGIAIGLTVSLGIYLVGNISGAVFNPSVFFSIIKPLILL